jgi:Pilus formation protein N terminal region
LTVFRLKKSIYFATPIGGLKVTDHSPFSWQGKDMNNCGAPSYGYPNVVSIMIKRLLPAALLGLTCLVATSMSAYAGQVLTVEVDESQILTLPTAPGAIVIGNPSIADVSIQGQKIFIHGRGFGQTNITILDLQGEQIANFDVIGKHTQVSNVAVFKGPKRYSYACSTYCESEIQVGDEEGYVKGLLSATSAKIELATGNKTAEAAAPAAPQ